MKETIKALTSCMILQITYKFLSASFQRRPFRSISAEPGKISEKDTISPVGGKIEIGRNIIFKNGDES